MCDSAVSLGDVDVLELAVHVVLRCVNGLALSLVFNFTCAGLERGLLLPSTSFPRYV